YLRFELVNVLVGKREAELETSRFGKDHVESRGLEVLELIGIEIKRYPVLRFLVLPPHCSCWNFETRSVPRRLPDSLPTFARFTSRTFLVSMRSNMLSFAFWLPSIPLRLGVRINFD